MNSKIAPTNDLFVKTLFGKAENQDLLLDFLNAVMEHSGHPPIESVTILNPELPLPDVASKRVILDLLVRDKTGRAFNIEVQNYHDRFFAERSLFYWANAFVRQIDRGMTYESLEPVECINLLDFGLFEGTGPYSRHQIVCVQGGLENAPQPPKPTTALLALHFLELPKLAHDKRQLVDKLYRWMYFFLREEKAKMNLKQELLNDPIIRKAHENWLNFTHDPVLAEQAAERERALFTYYHGLAHARKDGLDEGRAEGKAEGLAEGIEIGIEQGIEKGMALGVHKNALETARKMKQEGYETMVISRLTNLTSEEIDSL